MKLQKLFKSYKILVITAVTCIKEGINCGKIKNMNVIKCKTIAVYTSNWYSVLFWFHGTKVWEVEDRHKDLGPRGQWKWWLQTEKMFTSIWRCAKTEFASECL